MPGLHLVRVKTGHQGKPTDFEFLMDTGHLAGRIRVKTFYTMDLSKFSFG